MVTDQELWEAIKNNNEKAFATLFYRYSSRIYSKAYCYVRDKALCEEIVHDIFLTLWVNRRKLQIQSFIGYLTSAARYRVYKHITAGKIIPVCYKDDMEDLNSYSTQNTGYNTIIYNDMELEVSYYLNNLPKRCKEIFLMSRKQQFSNDEIAVKLGISKRTVENQITCALKHLRLSLKSLSVIFVIAENLTKLIFK